MVKIAKYIQQLHLKTIPWTMKECSAGSAFLYLPGKTRTDTKLLKKKKTTNLN